MPQAAANAAAVAALAGWLGSSWSMAAGQQQLQQGSSAVTLGPRAVVQPMQRRLSLLAVLWNVSAAARTAGQWQCWCTGGSRGAAAAVLAGCEQQCRGTSLHPQQQQECSRMGAAGCTTAVPVNSQWATSSHHAMLHCCLCRSWQ